MSALHFLTKVLTEQESQQLVMTSLTHPHQSWLMHPHSLSSFEECVAD